MSFLKEYALICLIVTILFSFTCWYVYTKTNKARVSYPDMNHAISVMAIVEAIQKLCPLGPLNQWQLLQVGVGFPRCWHRSFPMKILDENIRIYGGSLLVRAPALCVMKMIADTNCWAYWISVVPKCLETEQFEDPLLRGDGFMQSTKIVNKSSNNHSYMFSHSSKDNLGWILFWNTKSISFSFFLIQPLLKDETQCLLTYILGCYSKSSEKNIAERLIYNLNSIKDATEVSLAHVLPFFLNYSFENKKESLLDLVNSTADDGNKSKMLPKRKLNKSSIKNSSRALLLLPFMQPSIPFIKGFKFFELTVSSLKDNYDPSSTSYQRIQKKKLKGYSCKELTLHTPKNVVSRPKISLPLNETDYWHLLYEHKEVSFYDADKENDLYDTDIENDPSDADLESNIVHGDSTSEFELLLPDLPPISNRRLADIKTRGNYSASELQLQILEASSVDFLDSVNRPHLLGDWFPRGTIKGISVCSKISISGSFKILSFVCRANIPVKPEEVWKFVKNPYCRFVCDESVKKVRILEEISTDQKIVYVYSEIGMLKKEVTDFCFLHTERQEKSKYYLAFHSTEFENCPLMDSVTRGTLLPSGFVIEADGSNENISTEVKYLYQTLIDNPNSLLLQELDTSVASFLQNLKNYLLTKPF